VNQLIRAIGVIVVTVVAIGSQATMAGLAAAPTTGPAAAELTSAVDSGTATVSGTSTLHDWTVKSTTIIGKIQSSGSWTATPPTLESIQLSIPVNTLKSSEGSGMDDKVYDALKMKANPLITYALTLATLKSAPSKDDPEYHYDAAGQLTIAGTTRTVNLTLDVTPANNGTLSIATQTPLKMTDFGMTPPTAMLGMIKSGDAVTVKVTRQLATKGR
jgi:polyisoprenoid-binding protein YceI